VMAGAEALRDERIREAAMTELARGRVTQVIGPAVDIYFEQATCRHIHGLKVTNAGISSRNGTDARGRPAPG